MTDASRGFRARLVTAAAMSALLTAGCATTPGSSTSAGLALGQNAAGDPCEATLNWTDASFGDDFTKTQRSYSVGCRSLQSSGTQARVRLFDTPDARSTFTGTLSCGAQKGLTLADFGETSARRCVDPALGLESIVIDADANGQYYQLSSAINAVGPGVQALRLLAGFDAPGSVTSDRVIAGLSDVPDGPGEADTGAGTLASDNTIDIEETLRIATRQIFLGNYANASSLLKSALVQVDDNTPPSIEAELLLEAGLADSNIRFFESATSRLNEAETILQSPNVNRASILGRKLAIYRGLHALNQRRFVEAKSVLSSIIESEKKAGEQSLLDPVGLSILNSAPKARDVRNALSVTSEEDKRELLLTAQAEWGLSVAAIAENDFDEAQRSLGNARETFGRITGIEPAGVRWLEARFDRQQGRILAAQGNYDDAIEAFGEAEKNLRESSRAVLGTGADPAIAELALETASLKEKAGRSQADVDAAYAAAVSALVNVRGQQATFATAPLVPYLDRLLEKSKAGDQKALADYFQALQITSESGAARQISQLQEQVAAGSDVGKLIRNHADAERALNDAEFALASGEGDTEKLQKAFNDRRQEFVELDAQLQSNSAINRISDRPAKLSALQQALGPGEVYVKLTIIGDTVYGLLIDKNGATPYSVETSAAYLQSLVGDIRNSIDGKVETERTLDTFNLFFASLVYDALFGQVDTLLDGRSSIVVDGGQTLRALTPAVLVTDSAAKAKPIEGRDDRLDYSEVPFMIQKAPISIASSPSSFIASKGLGASNASLPLLGFADPRPLAAGAQASGNDTIGPCNLTPVELADLSTKYAPIPKREVEIAANALGVSDFTVISGDEFTDANLIELGEDKGSSGSSLSRYKVLHFATHGASEGQFGCEESPPALLTSFGGDGDMLLSLEEIPRLKLDANLVVLSACETETVLGEGSLERAGGVQPGETLAGLVKAFFSANAKAVMATYWEASANEDSEVFFETFYSSGRTKSIASSLQDAQTELIQTPEFSHPFFWGPFFVVGNTSNGLLADGNARRAENGAGAADELTALAK